MKKEKYLSNRKKINSIVIFFTITMFIALIGYLYYSNHDIELIKGPQISPTSTQSPPLPTPSPIREKAVVVKVFDGDSILLSDGRQVRYIGVNSPETGGKTTSKECFSDEATKANTALVLQQTIEMENDKNDTDVYKRLLRYVYVDGEMVNDFLVRWGYARAEKNFPEDRYKSQFITAEKEARSQTRGLWGKCH